MGQIIVVKLFQRIFYFMQVIREELIAQEQQLERIRSAAAELGRSVTMSPVVVELEMTVGLNGESSSSEATIPTSLAATADRVAQHLQLLRQSINVQADTAAEQSKAAKQLNGAIVSADKLIDSARQTLCTVEEDKTGERIEDQLVVLRDQLLQLSPTEQQLNNAPSEQLVVTLEARPQAAICAATSSTLKTTLQVRSRKTGVFVSLSRAYQRDVLFCTTAMGEHLSKDVCRVRQAVEQTPRTLRRSGHG